MTMETTSINNGRINHSQVGMGVVSKIAALVFSLLAKAASYIKTRHQQKIDRAAFNNMLSLDDNILKDIGITYGDVVWASKLPLSQNAAQELNKIARENKLMRL